MQKHLKGVSELAKHKDDKTPLKQATFHEQRTFIPSKKERDQITSLLKGNISIQDFLRNKSSKSENFSFIHDLVQKFKDEEKLPGAYVRFLAEVSKATPVAGYMQITERGTLKTLRGFCMSEVNIRDGYHQQDLCKLQSELPALWTNLIDILNYEGTTFLPKTVSRIVLRLIKIRIDTFKLSEIRYQEDYFVFEDDQEDQCSFFPNHKLIRHPKLYAVSQNVDKDACQKTFSTKTQFADGVFSIGKYLHCVNCPFNSRLVPIDCKPS